MASHGKSMEASHCRRPRFHSSDPPSPFLPVQPPDHHPLCFPPRSPPHFRASRKRSYRERRVFGHLSIILYGSRIVTCILSKNTKKIFFIFFLFQEKKIIFRENLKKIKFDLYIFLSFFFLREFLYARNVSEI